MLVVRVAVVVVVGGAAAVVAAVAAVVLFAVLLVAGVPVQRVLVLRLLALRPLGPVVGLVLEVLTFCGRCVSCFLLTFV